MRKVAGYLVSARLDSEDKSARLDAIDAIVSAWISSKGECIAQESRRIIQYRDGRRADYWTSVTSSPHGRVIEHDLVEPTDSGLFQTHIAIGEDGSELAAYVELCAAGDAYQIGPMRIDVRCPQVVRNLIDCGERWTVGETPVTSRPVPFTGMEDALTLIDVIWHPLRNLPVVAVSPHEGAFLTDTFAESLASDLSGLALVATLDDAASWAITRVKGKEWSCYSGGVRLYWPMGLKFESPYAHPLWTRSALMRGVTEPRDASYRIRRQLRTQIIGLSAFSVLEPPFFELIRSESRRREFESLRAKGTSAEEWQKIAESYAAANDKLRAQLTTQEELVRDLQSRVSGLELAVQWKDGSGRDTNVDLEPEFNIPPATVEEAIYKAKENARGLLIFGDDVATGIKNLAADAGPPDKILNYLSQLRALGEARSRGALGTSMIQWLRDRGINASTESDTIRNSASEMRKRTWHDGNKRRSFELHLKPNEATSPDRCARIYFDFDDQRSRIVVGWVGRHP